jgi:hypothetical protein
VRKVVDTVEFSLKQTTVIIVRKRKIYQLKSIEKRIQDLFESYNDVLKNCESLKVIRSTNNPAGDYGDILLNTN